MDLEKKVLNNITDIIGKIKVSKDEVKVHSVWLREVAGAKRGEVKTGTGIPDVVTLRFHLRTV